MPSKISKTKQKHSWQFEAIGTAWSIEATTILQDSVRREIEDYIESFDRAYSRFRDDSTVGHMATVAGTFQLPSNGTRLGQFYKKLYDATDGAVTPLVGDSLDAAGYDKNYSFKAKSPIVAHRWEEAMAWQTNTIKTLQPIKLDIGAAGKGLLVDEIAKIIQRASVKEYVIDASGDVLVQGAVQRIGLENPLDPTMVIGAIEVSNESLCASAANRRKWGDGWHHVLDARTGSPVNDVTATWVIAESTMIADGLATALFFVSAERLQTIAPFDYVRLLADGTVEYSKRFVGQLFT